MSFNISCPTCGDRQVEEFQYGSEQEPRPSHESSDSEWNFYLYSKNNAGVHVNPERDPDTAVPA